MSACNTQRVRSRTQTQSPLLTEQSMQCVRAMSSSGPRLERSCPCDPGGVARTNVAHSQSDCADPFRKIKRCVLQRDWAADRVSNAVGAQVLASLKRRPHFQGLFPRLLLSDQLKQRREAAHTCGTFGTARSDKLCTVTLCDRVGLGIWRRMTPSCARARPTWLEWSPADDLLHCALDRRGMPHGRFQEVLRAVKAGKEISLPT